ncbi:MAG TPA: hybrid sensor histidine kinase/response regulator, partial [Polyangiaceae bacterium]|nr:hybrid sensor histidine kinase/response regulator [Polyangiaceae bacterium]
MSRVLHIEDDPRNRLLVRKLLAGEGHEVIDATDGLEGVRAALTTRPDLVLVDLNIPGLDGYEVTLRLRSEPSLSGVPIVAITAEGDRDTSFAVGCDGFIQKPIDARSFAQLVRRYLSGHREPYTSSADATGERLRLQSHRIVQHLEQKVAELSATNARLREVERLRTEFYRNISHELATPMTPIVGYLRMLLDEELGPLNKPQNKALRAMDDCVRRLRGTLDNLIDVTGLETGRMRFFHREYDFLDTVRRALAAYADAFAERQLTLLEEMPRGPLPAYGDSDRLARAMSQLLDNACKFTPQGGIVGVHVRVLDAHYEVLVADSGSGVPPERAERVFDPFYQVDGSPTRAHGGVGVGLAIARRVARGLGGDVKLASGATVEGMYLTGAAFSLSVAKRAPTVVLDAS